MSAGDLLHERQAQPTSLRAGSAWNAVEHGKQPFARTLGDDRSMIADAQDSQIILSVDGYFDGWLAMKLGIFDEVADHSAQQRRVSVDGHWPCFHGAIVVARAFLGGEGGQVDVLTNVQLFGRIEAADQKDLIDGLVEFGDVLLELRFTFRRTAGELETEPDARQRRPQLMRRIGEQHLVRVDQALDASGGLVEALGEPRDFVATFDLDPRAQVAGPEGLDAVLQPFEPSGESSHHGTGAERDHERDGPEECREHERARAWPRRDACHQPPTVGKRDRDRRSARRSHPAAGLAAATRSRKPTSRRCQTLVAAAEQRQVSADALGQPLDRLLLSLRRGIRRRDKLGDDLAGNLELLPEWRKRRAEMPEETCRD